MLEMYPAKVNSPETEITTAINATDTAVTVDDISVIPDAPNLLVIGGDTEDPETVKLTAISENVLTIERGFQGIAEEWPAGTKIARNFTAYDHDTFKGNIEQLDERISVPKYATEEGYPDVLSIPNTAVDGDMKVGIKGQTVQNLVKNGDFSEGTNGWEGYLGGQLSINSSGNLVVTGNGVNSSPYVRQVRNDLPIVQAGHKFYYKAKMRTTNSNTNKLQIAARISDTGYPFSPMDINSPAINIWYNASNISTVPTGRSGYLILSISASYPDAETSNGQSHEVERNSCMCIDMGVDSTNPFYNKTVEQMDEMFAQWTDDLSSTLGSKRIRSLGRNLWDNANFVSNVLKASSANSLQKVEGRNCIEFVNSKMDDKPVMDFKFKSNAQYILSLDVKFSRPFGNSSGNLYVGFMYIDGIASFLRSDPATTTFTHFKLISSPGKTIRQIYISYGSGAYYLIDLDSIQLQELQEGTEITEEPYTEDIAYTTAEKNGELQELRNVPNGVADEIRLNSDGNGLEFVKRCEKVIIDGNTNISTLQTVMNEDTFVVQFRISDIPYSAISTSIDDIAWFVIDGIKFTNQAGYEGLNDIWKVAYNYYVGRTDPDNYVATIFSIPKADVDWTAEPTLQQVKDYLNAHPITLIYQLLQEEVTTIQWTGLTCKKDGTVLIETIVPEIGFYGTQATTKHPTQLIGSVDRLYKVDRDTGVRTRLDVSKCVISSDKLSFTHVDLVDGDLLDWDYVPETSYTQGYKSVTVPTNMAATVEGLVENSKVQKENIRQLEYKTDTKISTAISNIPKVTDSKDGLVPKEWVERTSGYISSNKIVDLGLGTDVEEILNTHQESINNLQNTIGNINSVLDSINGEVI